MRWMMLVLIGCSTGAEQITPTAGDPETETEENEVVDAVEPAPACGSYLACLEAREDSVLEIAQAAFGESSACWEDPLLAYECATACRDGVLEQRTEDPLEPACWGEGPPGTPLLFAALPSTFFRLDLVEACWFSSEDYFELDLVAGFADDFEIQLDDGFGGAPQLSLACALDAEDPQTFGCEAPRFRRGGKPVMGSFGDDWASIALEFSGVVGCTVTGTAD